MSIQISTLGLRFWITCLSRWHQALLGTVGSLFLWQENETFSKCSGTFFFNAHATAKTRRANMNNVVYGAYAPKAIKKNHSPNSWVWEMILYFCLGTRFSGQRPRYSYLYALLKHLLSHARIKGAYEHRKNGVFLRQRKMKPTVPKVPVVSGEFDPRNPKVEICCHKLLNSKCHAKGSLKAPCPQLREFFSFKEHFRQKIAWIFMENLE